MAHASVTRPVLPVVSATSRALARCRHVPLLMYGVLCLCLGLNMHLLGVMLGLPRYLLNLNQLLLPLNEWIVWYSGVPIVAGLVLTLTDLFVLFPGKRRATTFRSPAYRRTAT